MPIAAAATTGRRIVVTGRQQLLADYPAIEIEPDQERSLIALPLFVEGRRLGAISLAFRYLRDVDEQELEFLGTLADSCAHALARLEAIDGRPAYSSASCPSSPRHRPSSRAASTTR